jgi:hypothetical protein
MQVSGSGQPSLRRAHELLGVPAQADAAQIARAYRRQARRLHPDVSVEPDATEQFWALQAAYRVAAGAAPSDGPQVPAQVPAEVPAEVARHDPLVVLGGPFSSGLPATAGPGQSGVAWLAAGPVHVRPPQRPKLGNEPRTEPRAEPGAEPDTGAMSSGEGR